jgi:hypothetical protein
MNPAFRLSDVKITGGKITNDTADLLVQGTMTIRRVESYGDITEVDQYPVKGSVQLRLVGGKWFRISDSLEKATQ